jgi:hypothetical protein
MVDRIGFKVEGLTQVVRDLQTVGADVEDLKDAFAGIAAEGARIASGFTPVRTGRLAASTRGNRAKSKAVITQGRGSVPYAGPVNYGWPRRHIQPALQMQRADERMGPVAIQRLEDDINQSIKRRGLQ